MKNKIVSILCLMTVVSTGLAHFAQATQGQMNHKAIPQPSKNMSVQKLESPKPPMIDPAKMKEARDACIVENKLPMLKKGEKPSPEQREKFSNCMHEKLAAEVNKIRQQKR